MPERWMFINQAGMVGQITLNVNYKKADTLKKFPYIQSIANAIPCYTLIKLWFFTALKDKIASAFISQGDFKGHLNVLK